MDNPCLIFKDNTFYDIPEDHLYSSDQEFPTGTISLSKNKKAASFFINIYGKQQFIGTVLYTNLNKLLKSTEGKTAIVECEKTDITNLLQKNRLQNKHL
jgi:hypothetical protein